MTRNLQTMAALLGGLALVMLLFVLGAPPWLLILGAVAQAAVVLVAHLGAWSTRSARVSVGLLLIALVALLALPVLTDFNSPLEHDPVWRVPAPAQPVAHDPQAEDDGAAGAADEAPEEGDG